MSSRRATEKGELDRLPLAWREVKKIHSYGHESAHTNLIIWYFELVYDMLNIQIL